MLPIFERLWALITLSGLSYLSLSLSVLRTPKIPPDRVILTGEVRKTRARRATGASNPLLLCFFRCASRHRWGCPEQGGCPERAARQTPGLPFGAEVWQATSPRNFESGSSPIYRRTYSCASALGFLSQLFSRFLLLGKVGLDRLSVGMVVRQSCVHLRQRKVADAVGDLFGRQPLLVPLRDAPDGDHPCRQYEDAPHVLHPVSGRSAFQCFGTFHVCDL